MALRAQRRGAALTTVLLTVLVLGVFLLALVVWSRERLAVVQRGGSPGDSSKLVEPSTPRTARVSEGAADSPIPGLPTLARKPKPVSSGYKECPPEGDGGDTDLNRLKNRTDSATWLGATYEAVRTLPWPRGVERRQRGNWTRSDRNRVARYEGLPLSIEGYFTGAKQEGPEAPNCHGADADFRDWHIWLSGSPGPDRTNAIVVETTPAVRALHPRWKLSAIRRLARDSTRVRVSGWLFLDPEHPDQVGKTRGTIWEIHPVMRIEAWKNGRWEVME
jgi:hypothetical protein